MTTKPLCQTCHGRPSEVGLSICPACGPEAPPERWSAGWPPRCKLCLAPLRDDGTCTLCQPPPRYDPVPPYRAPFDKQLVMLADGLVEIEKTPLPLGSKRALRSANRAYADLLTFEAGNVARIQKAEGR